MHSIKHTLLKTAGLVLLTASMNLFSSINASADENVAGLGIPSDEIEEFLDQYDGPLNFLDLYFPASRAPFQIRIRFDDQYEELTTKDTKNWRFKRGNTYEWDDEKVTAYFESIKGKYETEPGVINFKDHDGNMLTFNSQCCGWHMNVPFTVKYFKEVVDAGEPIYDPFWNSGLTYSSKSDVGMKYVEVDISEQTVYLFEYNELILQTPCVTGLPDEFNHTITGVFQVNYKSSPSILKGEDAGGNGYEQPVEYWIAFNGGQGLHDATWRYDFGGDIYLYNGSHGCVNLPLDMAGRLYKEVYPMYPVIVHD